MTLKEDIQTAIKDIEEKTKNIKKEDIIPGIWNFMKGLILIYVIIAPIGHIAYFSNYCNLDVNNQRTINNTNIKETIQEYNKIVKEYNQQNNYQTTGYVGGDFLIKEEQDKEEIYSANMTCERNIKQYMKDMKTQPWNLWLKTVRT